MDRTEVRHRVRRTIGQETEILEAGDVDDAANLFDRGLTSLTSVRILVALEEEFSVVFPDELMARSTFSTVETIVDAVYRCVISDQSTATHSGTDGDDPSTHTS